MDNDNIILLELYTGLEAVTKAVNDTVSVPLEILTQAVISCEYGSYEAVDKCENYTTQAVDKCNSEVSEAVQKCEDNSYINIAIVCGLCLVMITILIIQIVMTKKWTTWARNSVLPRRPEGAEGDLN
jgi:hypothetical protein